MSVEERNQYREQIRNAKTAEEREKLMAAHREEMQVRAKAKGVPMEDLEVEEAE